VAVCELRGQLRISRLIAEHGSGVLDLRTIIGVDSPRMQNPSTPIYERCGVHFAVVRGTKRSGGVRQRSPALIKLGV